MSLLVLAAVVVIDGETTCPSPAQIREHLGVLLADQGSDHDAPDRARIAETADAVELELESASGRILGHRAFSRQASCDQLAAAVAVVIATWETTADGVAPTISVETHAPAASTPASSLSLVVSAGGATVVDRGGWTPGASLELALGSIRSRWAGLLDAIVTESNAVPLAPGSASWARERLAIGASFEVVSGGPFALDADGQLVAGLLVASGMGFSADHSTRSFDPGAAVGLRARFAWGDWGLVVAASETAWLRANHLAVTGLSQIDAPRHDFVLGVGIAWRVVKP